MDTGTINALYPQFLEDYGDKILAHLRTKTFGMPKRYEVKTAYIRGDDKIIVFFREKIAGHIIIDYSEPCLIFVPK